MADSDPDREGLARFVPPRALYVHVPLCASKCAYCDFFSLPASSLAPGFETELVSATLDRAASLVGRFCQSRAEGARQAFAGARLFDTVYLGGGTPTMLSPLGLEQLFKGIAELARFGDEPESSPLEWSVEANPDSLSREKLELMARLGARRISIGVQSLDPEELSLLGRVHGPEDALAAVSAAAALGLDVSADLMASLPRASRRGDAPSRRDSSARDPGRLARYAKELVASGASHLSIYDLTLEEGTPLHRARLGLDFPDEDEAWEERRELESALGELGFRRYEVSNYAPVGKESLHNLAYWRMDSYLGAGPGAVSTIAREDGSSLRIEEPKNAASYRASWPEANETAIDFRDAAFETAMMAFRTSFGLDLEAFESRFGMNAETLLAHSLESWALHIVPGEPWPARLPRRGGSEPGRRIALDGAGMDLLNRFLGDCLDELDSKL